MAYKVYILALSIRNGNFVYHSFSFSRDTICYFHCFKKLKGLEYEIKSSNC